MQDTAGLRRLAVLLIIIVLLAAYWPVQNHRFVNYDDEHYVSENRFVRSGLNAEGLVWAFTAMEMGHWHPLTWLSHMVDYQIFSGNPAGHHWTNLLIHILNTLLLLDVLRRFTGAFWRSLVVASLFALHPLNVESVAWIAERKNLLSASFWFLTLSAYHRYLVSPGAGRYVVMLIAFFCGLLAKAMLVTLPFVMLLLDDWPLARQKRAEEKDMGIPGGRTGPSFLPARPARLLLEKVPLFVLALLSSVMAILAADVGDNLATIGGVPIGRRIINAVTAYAVYVEKVIWPRDLAVFYPYPQTWSPAEAGGAALFLFGATALAFWQARQRPYLRLGWLWYLGTLVPVIGLVQSGGQAMADRYTYIPAVGIFIIIVWGISDATLNWRRRRILLSVLSGSALAGLLLCTVIQLSYWRNSITLFERALKVTTNNHVAHGNLGEALMKAGRMDEAIAHFKAALKIRPDAGFYNNLGMALAETGHIEQAVSQYREALRIRPGYEKAVNNIGVILGRQGKLREAGEYFMRALELREDYADAHGNMGLSLMLGGDPGAAVSYYEKAARFDPDNPKRYRDLGEAMVAAGKPDEAALALREARRLTPSGTKRAPVSDENDAR